MAQLLMKRPAEIGGAPAQRGPLDIALRTAVSADAERLARLLAAAFPEMEWSAERARRDLLDATDVTDTYVVESDGELVATASCRHLDARFPGAGYVHWVAVDPTRRGSGLADVVMQAVMQRFVAQGRPEIVLETDDQRLAAIGAYLRLGFVPQYPDSEHESRWSRLFTQLAEGRKGKR